MKKKKASPEVKIYTATYNNNGFQVRLHPDFEMEKPYKVKEFFFDPDLHEPRPGDLIVRKVVMVD